MKRELARQIVQKYLDANMVHYAYQAWRLGKNTDSTGLLSACVRDRHYELVPKILQDIRFLDPLKQKKFAGNIDSRTFSASLPARRHAGSGTTELPTVDAVPEPTEVDEIIDISDFRRLAVRDWSAAARLFGDGTGLDISYHKVMIDSSLIAKRIISSWHYYSLCITRYPTSESSYALMQFKLRLCCAASMMPAAQACLQEMKQNFNLKAEVFTWLIRGFNQTSQFSSAISVYEDMLATHIIPDLHCRIANIRSLLGQDSHHLVVWQHFLEIKDEVAQLPRHSLLALSGFYLQIFKSQSIAGEIDNCIDISSQMNALRLDTTSLHSYLAMSYSKMDRFQECLTYIQDKKELITVRAYNNMLACGLRTRQPARVAQDVFYNYILESGCDPDSETIRLMAVRIRDGLQFKEFVQSWPNVAGPKLFHLQISRYAAHGMRDDLDLVWKSYMNFLDRSHLLVHQGTLDIFITAGKQLGLKDQVEKASRLSGANQNLCAIAHKLPA